MDIEKGKFGLYRNVGDYERCKESILKQRIMKESRKIGIDPAFRKSGIGFCIRSEGNIEFRKYSVLELLKQINLGEFQNDFVAVENSNLQKTSFDRRGSKAVIAKKSRDAGKNMAVSQIICDALELRCKNLIQVSPKQKGAKFLKSKLVYDICKSNKWEIEGNKAKAMNQDDRCAFKIMLWA